MKKCVSNKITIINFIMTMCIVIYHFWYGYNGQFNIANNWSGCVLRGFNGFCNFLGILAMSMFFLLSGFLLYNGANTSKDMLKKWKSRIFTLLIPFLIWNTFMLLYKMIAYELNAFTSFWDFISGYIVDPYNGPLWYMIALFILMLFAPLVIKLKNHKKFSIVFMFVVIVLSQLPIYDFLTSKIWYLGNTLSYFPLYVIGAFMGMHYSDKIFKQDYNVKKFRLISFAVMALCLLLYFTIKHFLVIKLIVVFAPISLWFILDAKIFNKKILFPFKVSFFMYVMHAPFLISIAYKVMSLFYYSRGWMYPIEAVLYRILGTVLIWGMAIAFAYLFKFIFSEKVYSAMSGNRTKVQSQNIEKEEQKL